MMKKSKAKPKKGTKVASGPKNPPPKPPGSGGENP